MIEEADKGYHSRTTMHDLETLAIRTYISEPDQRLLVHAGAFNLGLWMRTLFGVGTPRSLQGRAAALGAMITVLCALSHDVIAAIWLPPRDHTPSNVGFRLAESVPMKIVTGTTGPYNEPWSRFAKPYATHCNERDRAFARVAGIHACRPGP